MKLDGSLLFSQKAPTYPYTETDESSENLPPYF
jgi:hypothetical protein